VGGSAVASPGAFAASTLSAVKARIGLMLDLAGGQ